VNETYLVDPAGPAVALLTPAGDPPPLAGGGGRDAQGFHRTMPGYRPTPLRRAPQAAARIGAGEVWVKDESSRLGLPSFKILGASWAVCRALRARLGDAGGASGTGDAAIDVRSFQALKEAAAALAPLTLSAATDGNHGRAVARMAKLLGLRAQIYVPAGTARARIDGIASEGATVTVLDGGYDDAVARSAQDAADRCLVISDTSWEGYTEVPGWVIDGYGTIFAEIEETLAGEGRRAPDVVVVPVGVGALAAAVVRHYRNGRAPRPMIVGVEPTSAACLLESVAAGEIVTLTHPQESMMAGLNCATPSMVAWPEISRGIDVHVAVEDERVGEATRLLARDGIVAGETGAGALAGMLAVAGGAGMEQARAALRLDGDASVLLLCTEGATDPEAYRRLTR
jgi:diaminopropionate ammonia-lyase